jgi:hypothetical protein
MWAMMYERDIDAIIAQKTSVLLLRLTRVARPTLLPISQQEIISPHLPQHQTIQQPNSNTQSIPASVMACVDPFLQFDDESFALELQLKEIAARCELQKNTEEWGRSC